MENACWVVTIPHLHLENNIWNCLAVIPGFTWASSSSKCSPAIFLPGLPVHCLCRSLTLDDRCAIIGCQVQNIYHDQSFSWFFCMRWQCLNQPSWALMSLPIRYSPMVFYFRLSIIFLTPQVLRHLLRRRDLLQPSREPLHSPPTIPYTHCTIGPVPCRRPLIWPTDHIVTFPFLSLFSLPNAVFHSPTNRRSSHHAIRTLPYASLHTNLVLILLIVCI